MSPKVADIKQFAQPAIADFVDEGAAESRAIELNPSFFKLEQIGPEVLVGSLRDGRLHVYSPFLVKISTEGPNYIAEAPEFNEFGFGENLSDALIDLQRTISELYLTLEEDQDNLGPDLQKVWFALQQKIQKIQK